MSLRFIVPVGVDAPTGGNVYDLAVTDALRVAGVEVELVRCDEAELSAVLRQKWPGPTLVDGLLACRQPTAVSAAVGPVAVLVHMPLTWEGGLASAEAERLGALEHAALRAASLVIATSEWTARVLTHAHGLSTVTVAEPGVDRAAIVVGSTPALLVHVAALLRHKNQLGLVRALSQLADLPWQTRLAGDLDRDVNYVAEVRRTVRQLGLEERITLTGRLPREDAWAGADLALLPSLAESYGLVVTEALARGIPAVVSDGGPAEALGLAPDGAPPGLIVPTGDTDRLATVLRRWLQDDALRDTLRARALARREALPGWTATADQLRAALNLR